MTFSAAYDNMELGTSPLRQPEDVDLEDLDPMHDRSVDNSMLDEAEFVQSDDVDLMQADTEHFYDDDDEMLVEEHHNRSHDLREGDLDMGKDEILDDEEILYEEETVLHSAEAELEAEPIENHESAHSLLLTDVNAATVSQSAPDIFTGDNANEQVRRPEAIVQETLDEVENAEPQPQLPDQSSEEFISASKTTGEQGVTAKEDTEQGTEIVDFAAENQGATSLHDQEGLQLDEHDQHESEQSNNENLGTEIGVEARSPDVERIDNDTSLREEPIDDNIANSSTGMEQLSPRPATQPQPQIKVFYLGEEMSLFPPSEESETAETTFFLQDASLVDTAVDKLLSACRDVLGDTLEHDDELVLDVPSLGLHICEDSRYTASLTLAQVLNVYTKLCTNESLDLLQPLYCNISSRVRLSTQFTYLSNAAQEGRHFSEIAADYVNTPEDSGSFYQPTENIENITREVDAPGDDAEERYSLQSHGDEDNGTDTEEQEFHTAVTENAQATADTEEAQDSKQQDETVVSGELQVAATNVAEANRLAQENILNDIDNDLEGEADLDNTQASAATGTSESNDQTDRKGHLASTEGIEQHSEADTSSSHTIEAVPVDTEGQHEESTTDPELAQEEHDEAQYGLDDAHDAPDADGIDEHNVVQDDYEGEQHESAHEYLAEPLVKDVVLEQTNHEEPYEDEEWHPEDDENDLTEHDKSNLNSVLEESDLDFAQITEPSAPITPSKQTNSKRKAPEDEEDLDFLDLSTPEPKRTRSS